MKTCPNCLKMINENFTYCHKCGCNLEGGGLGDFKTDYLNVFHVNDEFTYLFAVHGRQIVLKANSIDELRELVFLNKLPWLELKN